MDDSSRDGVMSDSQNAKVNIERVYRPAEPFNVDPFDQSAVDYTKFADQITRVLESLESGAVVAIDAPWGIRQKLLRGEFQGAPK